MAGKYAEIDSYTRVMNDSVREVKWKLLSDLNGRMEEECRCTLRKTATRAVPGAGNPNADILFIGEAPGKNEDLQGIPFVGAAGKFLAEMLASIGLSREDIYITNVVKYRPPNNRDPLPEEIDDCAEWLREQLSLIDPKVIVTLGRHALNRFFPDAKISEVHGRAFRREIPGLGPRVFYVLYHPAAALYNGGMRDTLKQDFKKIPKILEKISKND
jgi:uracil-DNA glycosylase